MYKFETILNQYRQILGESCEEVATPRSQVNDELISEIRKCHTERDLCYKIEGFMRTLLRLTKNYKQHRNCVDKLEKLCQRVQLVAV
jgi:hypothetical protein